MTEYHVSQPAFSPGAADQSPLTPTATVSGSSARNAATRCRAAARSPGTGGIFTAATFGNPAIRPCSSSVKSTCVVRGLSYTHSGTDSSRVTSSYRPNTSSSVSGWYVIGASSTADAPAFCASSAWARTCAVRSAPMPAMTGTPSAASTASAVTRARCSRVR